MRCESRDIAVAVAEELRAAVASASYQLAERSESRADGCAAGGRLSVAFVGSVLPAGMWA